MLGRSAGTGSFSSFPIRNITRARFLSRVLTLSAERSASSSNLPLRKPSHFGDDRASARIQLHLALHVFLKSSRCFFLLTPAALHQFAGVQPAGLRLFHTALSLRSAISRNAADPTFYGSIFSNVDPTGSNINRPCVWMRATTAANSSGPLICSGIKGPLG